MAYFSGVNLGYKRSPKSTSIRISIGASLKYSVPAFEVMSRVANQFISNFYWWQCKSRFVKNVLQIHVIQVKSYLFLQSLPKASFSDVFQWRTN